MEALYPPTLFLIKGSARGAQLGLATGLPVSIAVDALLLETGA